MRYFLSWKFYIIFLILPLFSVYGQYYISSTAEAQKFYPYGIVNLLKFDTYRNKLFIAGNFKSIRYLSGATALFNLSTGQATTSFPKIQGTVYTIISDGNGGYYIGGSFNKVNNLNIKNLVHILPDYTVDQSFRPDPDGEIYALVLYNNILYVGGDFTSIFSQPRSNLASINIQDNSLTSWSPNPDGAINTIAISSSSLYVGGLFNEIQGEQRLNLASFNLQDNSLTSWSPNPDGAINTIAISSSSLYVGGLFNEIQGEQRLNLASFNLQDNSLTSWSPNPDGAINTIAISSSSLYVGGLFNEIQGEQRLNLASFNLQDNSLTSWSPNPDGAINTIAISSSSLYVGGLFVLCEDDSSFTSPCFFNQINNLAVFDINGNLLNRYFLSESENVNSLILDNQFLLVGGDFDSIKFKDVDNLAVFEANGDLSLDFNLNLKEFLNLSSNLFSQIDINDILITPEKIYLAISYQETIRPDFTTIGYRVLKISPDLQIINLIDTNGPINSLAISSSSLYIAGDFSEVNGQSRKNFAVLNLETEELEDWLIDTNGPINSLAISSSSLYIAGDFSEVNGQSRKNFAVLNLETEELNPLTFDFDKPIKKIYIFDNKIFFIGSFNRIGSVRQSYFAYFDLNNYSFSQDFNLNGYVSDIFLLDSNIYLGGHFTQVLSQPRNHIAAIDLNGNLLSWNPSFNGPVYTMALSTSSLYVGGSFSNINTSSVYNLARFLIINSSTTNQGNSQTGGNNTSSNNQSFYGGVGGGGGFGISNVEIRKSTSTLEDLNLVLLRYLLTLLINNLKQQESSKISKTTSSLNAKSGRTKVSSSKETKVKKEINSSPENKLNKLNIKTPTVESNLKKEIALQPINENSSLIADNQKINIPSYCKFNKVLKYGDTDSKIMKKYKNDKDKPVSCLQIFLKSQGKDIYDQEEITGIFDLKTKEAVIKFKQKFIKEIYLGANISSLNIKETVDLKTLNLIRKLITSKR